VVLLLLGSETDLGKVGEVAGGVTGGCISETLRGIEGDDEGESEKETVVEVLEVEEVVVVVVVVAMIVLVDFLLSLFFSFFGFFFFSFFSPFSFFPFLLLSSLFSLFSLVSLFSRFAFFFLFLSFSRSATTRNKALSPTSGTSVRGLMAGSVSPSSVAS